MPLIPSNYSTVTQPNTPPDDRYNTTTWEILPQQPTPQYMTVQPGTGTHYVGNDKGLWNTLLCDEPAYIAVSAVYPVFDRVYAEKPVTPTPGQLTPKRNIYLLQVKI